MSEKYIRAEDLRNCSITRTIKEHGYSYDKLINLSDIPTYTPADILAGMWVPLATATEDDMPPINPALHEEDPAEDSVYDAADPVLAMLEDGNIVKAVYSIQDGVGWWNEAVSLSKASGVVIHPICWMPLPELPKEVKYELL